MKQLIYVKGIIAVVIFCCCPFASAQTPIGTITFIEGVGDITRDNREPVTLKENDSICVNDRIRTKSYSKIQITFEDKSVVKLAPGSCLIIEEFKISPAQKRELARLKLTRGKLEAIVAKTGNPETFVIDTPNAKGAVKGSDIFVSYLAGTTGIFVKEGALALSNPAFPDTRATIIKGNCAFVPFNEVPQGMRMMFDTEMLIHKRDVDRALIKKWIPSKGSSKMNAIIVEVSGTVRIHKKQAQDWQPAKIEQVFEEGDTLQTADDGGATIRLSNGNSLIVASNTELSVATLRHDPKSGNYENTFAMAHGRVGAIVEKISKESTFQLKTPTVVCGVRGTLLEVVVPLVTAQEPAPQTQVFYEGGNGIVTSLLTHITQNIAPGENVTIDAAGVISNPFITTNEQRSGLVVMQQGALLPAGGLPGLNNLGSLVTETNGGPLGLAEAAITNADVSSLANATQSLEIASTVLSGQSSSTSSTSMSPFYTIFLTGSAIGPPLSQAPNISISLYDNHSWNAVITNGLVIDNSGSGMTVSSNGADQVRLFNFVMPVTTPWVADVDPAVSTVGGKTLTTGTATGPAVGNSYPPDLPFSGIASGTWN